MDTLFARLTEASTWSGLAGIALALGQGFPPIANWANGAAVVFGAMAMTISEGGKASPQPVHVTVVHATPAAPAGQ